MEDGGNQIQCPICNQDFDADKIERHVDSCLLNSQKQKPTTRRTGKSVTKQGFFERKPKRKLSTNSDPTEKKKKINGTNKDSDVLDDTIKNIIQNEESDTVQDQDTSDTSFSLFNNQTEDEVVLIDDSPTSQSTASSLAKNVISNTLSPMNEFQETLLKWSGKKVPDAMNTSLTDSDPRLSKIESESNIVNVDGGTDAEPKKEMQKSPLYDRNCLRDMTTREKMTKEKTRINNEDLKMKKKKQVTLGKSPLADQMRPTSFEYYFGQEAVNSNKILKELFYSQRIPSLIIWGPPGCGKTSLAHIISQSCKSSSKYRFIKMSATMSGISDVKETVKVAKNEKKLTNRQTVLFMDEVHRFNKMQQDSFLPHVEDGTIILIGATTENPSFHLNNALLSRCKLVVLSPLKVENIVKILEMAVDCLDGDIQRDSKGNGDDSACNGKEDHRFVLESGALQLIAEYANGDARVALNTLDILLQAKLLKGGGKKADRDVDGEEILITADQIKEELKRGYVNYDRNGDDHYDIISAFHKSIRGGDANAAVYWLARMLEGGETPLYVARRLVRAASEDIGLADPTAITQAVSAYQACTYLGMPECDVILAQVATYLARAPKSIETYEAYTNAKNTVRNWSGTQPSVPLHLRNAPTKTMKELGYGEGYKYTPKCQDDPSQAYLPPELANENFFET